MTDAPTDALLLEAVRSELGPGSTAILADIPPGTLWDHVLSRVATWMGRRILLVAADSAVPEIFCLDSEVSPAVIINGDYFERLATFRLAMFDPALGPVRADIVEQLFLETTAMHCLKVGDPDVGALLFQRSLHNRRYFVDTAQPFDASGQNLDSSASDLIEGFFPVIHEIGHMNRDTASLIYQTSPISDSSLLKRMEKVLDSISWMTPEVRDYALEVATRKRTSHILGLDNIRREGYADIFAAQRLYSMAVGMTQRQSVEFDPVAFMDVLHQEFNVVNVLQRTKLVAGMTKEYPLTAPNALAPMLYPVAMALRSYLMTVGLYGFAKSYLPEQSPVAAEGALLSEWLRVMGDQGLVGSMAECDAGMDRAMNALTPELILTGRESLDVMRQTFGRSPHARLAARGFLARASRLHLDTPLLRAFHAVVADPDGWDGKVEGEVRVYFLLVAVSPDQESQRLFSVPLEGRARAVCAFTSKETMEVFASGFVAQYLAPGETFGAAAHQVQHIALLEKQVRTELGEPITFVVEGSDAFGDLVRAVGLKRSGAPADDDAYAGVRQRAADAMADRYRLYAVDIADPASLEQFTQIVRLLEDE